MNTAGIPWVNGCEVSIRRSVWPPVGPARAMPMTCQARPPGNSHNVWVVGGPNRGFLMGNQVGFVVVKIWEIVIFHKDNIGK